MDADKAAQALIVFMLTKLNTSHLELSQKELDSIYSRFNVAIIPKDDKVHFRIMPRWRG